MLPSYVQKYYNYNLDVQNVTIWKFDTSVHEFNCDLVEKTICLNTVTHIPFFTEKFSQYILDGKVLVAYIIRC